MPNAIDQPFDIVGFGVRDFQRGKNLRPAGDHAIRPAARCKRKIALGFVVKSDGRCVGQRPIVFEDRKHGMAPRDAIRYELQGQRAWNDTSQVDKPQTVCGGERAIGVAFRKQAAGYNCVCQRTTDACGLIARRGEIGFGNTRLLAQVTGKRLLRSRQRAQRTAFRRRCNRETRAAVVDSWHRQSST